MVASSRPKRDIERIPAQAIHKQATASGRRPRKRKRFRIQVAPSGDHPPDAIINIEHERGGKKKEIEFQLKWRVDPDAKLATALHPPPGWKTHHFDFRRSVQPRTEQRKCSTPRPLHSPSATNRPAPATTYIHHCFHRPSVPSRPQSLVPCPLIPCPLSSCPLSPCLSISHTPSPTRHPSTPPHPAPPPTILQARNQLEDPHASLAR